MAINPTHEVSIEYCVPCGYTPRAIGLAQELLDSWAPVIAGLRLISGTGGRFEVMVDGELLYSKAETKRHPEPGEVAGLVETRLGPRLPRE
ncbi:MAG: selenoprotein W-related protein [Chloroflexota bacterium]|jgi:selenoprotein W-related protein|nr:selenoprotein W-related protein [Chloroflexota bacterium]